MKNMDTAPIEDFNQGTNKNKIVAYIQMRNIKVPIYIKMNFFDKFLLKLLGFKYIKN